MSETIKSISVKMWSLNAPTLMVAGALAWSINSLILAEAIGIALAFPSRGLCRTWIDHVYVGIFIAELQQIILARWDNVYIARSQPVDIQRHTELVIVKVLRLSGVPDTERPILQELLSGLILNLDWNMGSLGLLGEHKLLWINIQVLSRWCLVGGGILLWRSLYRRDIHDNLLVFVSDGVLELDCIELSHAWWWHDDLPFWEYKEAAV